MKLSILDLNGTQTGEVAVGDEHLITNGKYTQVLQDYVVAYHANQRQGSRSTKTKGEVAGTGKKPWRQKGTGRARAGMVRSPIWRKGGVVFGPRPRDFSIHLAPRIKTLAFRKAFSERMTANDIVVVDDLALSSPKTKDFLSLLGRLKISEKKTLVVQDGIDKNLMLASRNLRGVSVTTADTVNAYDLLCCKKIVFTKSALDKAVQRLGK